MNIFSVYSKLSPIFRRKRLARFLEVMAPDENTRILDVGGYPWFWTESGLDVKGKFTILNPHITPETEAFRSERFDLVAGDGTCLPYKDKEFDIVFSNSVIEHLGIESQQIAFAREAQRVGKRFWVQTPAQEFFIEPHLLAPCIHWLPKYLQRSLFRNWTVWGWMTRPDPEQVESLLQELRLLKRSDFQQMFPASTILTERFCSCPKSYVAFT